MNRYEAYPEYKDSSVGWVGQVPTHWQVMAIKWLTPVCRGASPRPIDDPKYFDDSGKYGWVRISDVTSSDRYLLETEQKLSDYGSSFSVRLPIGSLFLSIAGSVGKPCITGIEACIHDGFVYFPLLKIEPMWLYWIFEAKAPFVGLGKLNTQLNLNTETVGGIKISLPPRPERAKILKWLDIQTARIDTLIAKKTRFIELIRERIVALASQSPDSQNLQWVRLSHICEVISRPVLQQSGNRYTKLGLFNRGRGIFKRDETDTEDMGDSEFFWVQPGDLILSGQFAWEGAVSLTGEEHAGCVVSHRFPIVRGINNKVLTEYLFAYFLTSHGDFVLNDCSRGSAGRNRPLNMNLLLGWKIPVPSMQVQREIAMLVQLEKRIGEKVSKSVELLKEKRSALITAAVTGKIDVREAA